MRRMVTLVAGIVLALAMMAAPAAAHVLVVSPPGAGEPTGSWVGGAALPAQGKGLIPGGPTGAYLQSPRTARDSTPPARP
jgi:hypothetical protein